MQPYSTSDANRRFLREETQEWIRRGIIRPSKSAYASPVIVVDQPHHETTPKRFHLGEKVNKHDKSSTPCLPKLVEPFTGSSQWSIPGGISGDENTSWRYGIANEARALQRYQHVPWYTGRDVELQSVGLFVDPEQPSLGASPDAIVYDHFNTTPRWKTHRRVVLK
ncbi:hypothetical protein MRX96_020890 [Rhipicephalus microplus]